MVLLDLGMLEPSPRWTARGPSVTRSAIGPSTNVPVRFRDASWETRRFWGLRGRPLALLPDPLPEGVAFKAEALVYYPVYSVWRTGLFVRMDFTGHFRPESLSSGGQTTNAIPSGSGILKFKAVAIPQSRNLCVPPASKSVGYEVIGLDP